ncbi:hypothetical protein [Marinifilum flexuosum]|uniref:hypothetical protein n=1 Tax=Marinifilum flexuosum TaxID=1117708 RepID=UPI0024903CC6|nr:hypothetical protein [Marinifilum flexuosum]
MIKYFLLNGVLNFICIILWVIISGQPGGNVGMLPVLTLIFAGLQLLLGSITMIFVPNKIRTLYQKMIIMFYYLILFELSFLLLGDIPPIMNVFNESLSGVSSRGLSFSSLFSTGLTVILMVFIERKMAN